MATRKRVESWVVTDEFWRRVEPLIPVRERSADKAYVRKAGAGRPPKGRVRPDARHRLGVAEHRRAHVQGAIGALNMGPSMPPAGGRLWRPVVARRDLGQ